MKLNKNPKRALVISMSALVIIGVFLANFYYEKQNSAIDPRIFEARSLYSKYDSLAQVNDFSNVFKLLDAIEIIYTNIPYYKESFEVGVLYNNRSAAYLTMALYFESNSLSLDGINVLSKDSLLQLSKENAELSIFNYEQWLEINDSLSDNDLEKKIDKAFKNSFSNFSTKEVDNFIKKRVAEELESQIETPRRLSVAYTNLGIVYRHIENYTEAIAFYEKALVLWDRNLAAKNNLNKLLGHPIEKQNFINKILPPDRSE